MDTTYSTRVQAPNSNISDADVRYYDSTALKPSGGAADDTPGPLQQPDDKTTKQQKNLKGLLSCTRDSYLGTHNVRTIREHHKRLELAAVFLQSNLMALGVQEHRIVHDEEIRMERFSKGVHLITSSAWRNSRGASMGGVGIMVTKKAYQAISLIKSYGNRILLVSFNGNPRLTVIVVYSPTEAAKDDEAEDFHNNLRSVVRDVPAHHLLLTLGDLNAHLGKSSTEDPGWYYHSSTNRNGRLLRDTLQECCLEATNHRFQKRSSKMWTHLSDGMLTNSLIDYILPRGHTSSRRRSIQVALRRNVVTYRRRSADVEYRPLHTSKFVRRYNV